MDVLIRAGQSSDSRRLCEISSRSHLSDFYLNAIPSEWLSAFKNKYILSEERQIQFNRLYTRRLSDPRWHYYVACDDERIFGYTCSRLTGDTLQLKGLFVDPLYQSKGIGRCLFEASLAAGSQDTHIQLQVIPSNDNAKHLYRKFGFRSRGMSEVTFFGLQLELMEQR